MTLFTNEALKEAIKNTEKMMAKLANVKPSEELSLQDISNIHFYLEDYRDECKSILDKRTIFKRATARRSARQNSKNK